MTLNITPTVRLVSDTYGWSIEELRTPDPNNKRVKNTEPRWCFVGHYGSPSLALRTLVDKYLYLIAAESQSVHTVLHAILDAQLAIVRAIRESGLEGDS